MELTSFFTSSIFFIFGFGTFFTSAVAPLPASEPPMPIAIEESGKVPPNLNDLDLNPEDAIEIAPLAEIEEPKIIDIKIRPQDPSIGKLNAPVEIIEFTDFQCPFCKRFSDETFKQIKTNYIDTGKVRYSIRDFPLSFHSNAKNAAMAANCAHEQDKFWEMKEKIVEFQNDWSDSATPRNEFIEYTKMIEANENQFAKCYDDQRYADEIATDQADAQTYGVSGTPTFYINGEEVIGSIPYEIFEEIIERQLQ